ncbi:MULTISPECIES: YoaH family protein [unclassified Erwinia]|uniref:YoaH family protein n=1 Tax=unclassified Erwinia TaxID=2622719 RepID=UPI00083280FA|nr:YoaH family protein [Erwinia sp. ErVv1]
MITGLPALSYDQQQQAVERIQQLMSEGMSSGQAIQLVAAEIRENHTGDMITARFDDEEDDDDENEDQRNQDNDDYGDDDEEEYEE